MVRKLRQIYYFWVMVEGPDKGFMCACFEHLYFNLDSMSANVTF